MALENAEREVRKIVLAGDKITSLGKDRLAELDEWAYGMAQKYAPKEDKNGRLFWVAPRVLEDLKAWGIKATSIWTHFDDSANEWWSFLGRRSSHLAAPLRRGFFVFGGLSLPKIHPACKHRSRSCDDSARRLPPAPRRRAESIGSRFRVTSV